MDVTAIVLTTIVIVLQIITLVFVAKNKTTTTKPHVSSPVPHPQQDPRDFRKRRDDNRFNKRPVQENRPKPVVQEKPQAVDHVEKSLRDINLRLKNAERDQETARKKISDIKPAPVNQGTNQRRPDGGNSGNRNPRGRDDDFKRRDRNRAPGQFRERDQSRSQTIEKPQVEEAAAPVIQDTAPVQAAPVIEKIPTPIQMPVMETPVIQAPVISDVPENQEVLHGRKVLVRRRIISAEEQAAQAQESNQGSTQDAAPVQQNPVVQPESMASASDQPESQPIKFGR